MCRSKLRSGTLAVSSGSMEPSTITSVSNFKLHAMPTTLSVAIVGDRRKRAERAERSPLGCTLSDQRGTANFFTARANISTTAATEKYTSTRRPRLATSLGSGTSNTASGYSTGRPQRAARYPASSSRSVVVSSESFNDQRFPPRSQTKTDRAVETPARLYFVAGMKYRDIVI
jgi:hypothetical protein